MAEIFGALEREDTRGSHTVLREEVRLDLALREVFQENAWANFLAQSLDEGHSFGLVVAVAQVLLANELVVVDQLHVGALAESLTQRGFARGFRPNDARDLRKHSFPRVRVDVLDVPVGVNPANLAELLIVINDWHVLFRVCCETLGDGLRFVIGASLIATHQALIGYLLSAIEEQHVLSLTYIGLEVGALLNGPGKSVNEIVLIIQTNAIKDLLVLAGVVMIYRFKIYVTYLGWISNQSVDQKLNGQFQGCVLPLVHELLQTVSVARSLLQKPHYVRIDRQQGD